MHLPVRGAGLAAVAVAAAVSLTCRDTATPTNSLVSRIWHYPSQVSCRPRPPATDGQRVFVPFSDGYVRAFSLETGVVEWQTAVGGSLFDDIKVFGGLVIVQAGSGLVALNPEHGGLLWVRSDTSDYPRGVMSFDTLTGVVVAGGQRSSLWGVSVADGSVAWKVDLGEATRSTVIVGRTVFAGAVDAVANPSDASGFIFAVDLGSRTLRWSFVAPKLQVSSGFVAPLAVSSGFVVANAASGRVYGLDASTGQELWHFDGNVFLGGSISDGRLVYVPSSDGRVYARDLRTGDQAWTAVIGAASLYTEPALFGDSLVLTKSGNTLYALERSSGATAWTYGIQYNSICSTPLVVDSTIVFDAEDGIYAVRVRR